MTKEEIEELDVALYIACLYAVGRGASIGRFGIGNRVCPLGAATLVLGNYVVPCPTPHLASDLLPLTATEADAFIAGFDLSEPLTEDYPYLDLFKLGRSFYIRANIDEFSYQ